MIFFSPHIAFCCFPIDDIVHYHMNYLGLIHKTEPFYKIKLLFSISLINICLNLKSCFNRSHIKGFGSWNKTKCNLRNI